MSSAYVRLRLPDGEVRRVPPGGIIGRLAGAAARIEDPRVSEAHALVSLRGRELKLIALRGALRREVNGARPEAPLQELTLAPGLQIQLAEGVSIRVEEVALPEAILALEGLGPEPVELSAPVASFTLSPTLRLSPDYLPGAPARIWLSGGEWWIQLGEAPPERIEIGRRWQIGGQELRAVSVQLARAAVKETVRRGQLHPALRLKIDYNSAQIEPPGKPPLTLSGRLARLLYELHEFGSDIPWQVAAGELWPDSRGDEDKLRQNWDKATGDLRRELKRAGIREDLITSDGRGEFRLNLLPGDEVS